MTSLKNFPEVPLCQSQEDCVKYIARVLQWKQSLEKELNAKVSYTAKTIKHWETVNEKHPLYPHREQIASEWRVSLGTLHEVLGTETPTVESKEGKQA